MHTWCMDKLQCLSLWFLSWASLGEVEGRWRKMMSLTKRRRSCVARASTEEKYHSAVNELLTSDDWKNHPKLRQWFGNKWLKSKEVIFIIMMSQIMLFILQVLMDMEVNESNWTTTILTVMQSNIYNVAQRAKKVVSDIPGLVDFVFNFPDGQWCFLRNSSNRRTVKSIMLIKKLSGLVEMMSGLVNANFSLPEWQAVKVIFFAPWRGLLVYSCHCPIFSNAEVGVGIPERGLQCESKHNNGVERQNKLFKYSYLRSHKNNSPSVTLTILIQDFLPDNYSRLVDTISVF